LRGLGEVFLANGPHDQVFRDADVVWVRLRDRIDREFFSRAPNAKIIVTATTGLNHIDVQEADRRGIQILSLRGETSFLREIRATAEHSVGLMLALLRQIPAAAGHVREGGWDRDLFKGHELHEKTVGIIGYGRLGSLVARYLLAFGAKVLAADPNVMANMMDPYVPLVSQSELLRESDIVTLHVNFTESNALMIGAREFARMKHGSWFINTARGELVDQEALLLALRSGWISGAAIDVIADEQAPGAAGRLVEFARRNSNLLITPHIGGCTVESMEKTELFMAKKLQTALAAVAAHA
jgi:D-3-phosphoglycerate dehydrogenase